MAYTQADLDALDLEISKVRLIDTASFADQSTKFRSLEELLSLRAVMAQSIATAAGTTRTRLAATSKGV
jgi:hypothetical protein